MQRDAVSKTKAESDRQTPTSSLGFHMQMHTLKHTKEGVNNSNITQVYKTATSELVSDLPTDL